MLMRIDIIEKYKNKGQKTKEIKKMDEIKEMIIIRKDIGNLIKELKTGADTNEIKGTKEIKEMIVIIIEIKAIKDIQINKETKEEKIDEINNIIKEHLREDIIIRINLLICITEKERFKNTRELLKIRRTNNIITTINIKVTESLKGVLDSNNYLIK